jgi:hypothetical protein
MKKSVAGKSVERHGKSEPRTLRIEGGRDSLPAFGSEIGDERLR